MAKPRSIDAIHKRQVARFLDHLHRTGRYTEELAADVKRAFGYIFEDVELFLERDEVGQTMVAMPVLREAVSKLEDMMELASADMLMHPKDREYSSDLWLLIGKLRGSLQESNAKADRPAEAGERGEI